MQLMEKQNCVFANMTLHYTLSESILLLESDTQEDEAVFLPQ